MEMNACCAKNLTLIWLNFPWIKNQKSMGIKYWKNNVESFNAEYIPLPSKIKQVFQNYVEV